MKIIRANVLSLYNTTDFWSESALQNNHFNKSVFLSCFPMKLEANLCNNHYHIKQDIQIYKKIGVLYENNTFIQKLCIIKLIKCDT